MDKGEGYKMSLGSLSSVVVDYWPVVLIIGIVLTFFGYYLLRISMAIIGLITGIYLGQYVWTNLILKNFHIVSSDQQMIHIIAVLIIAFLVTALFIALYKFALFMMGFLAGGAIAYYIYNWAVSAMNLNMGSNVQWIRIGVFIVFGLIFGLLTIFNEKRAIGTAMAAIGALITAFAIIIPFSNSFNVKPTELLNTLIGGKDVILLTVFVAIFLVLSILSVSIQIGVKRGKKNDSKNQG
jgi:hypothetical protein